MGQHYNLFLSAVVLLVYYATIVGFDEKDTRYRMYANALLIAACCIGVSSFTGATDRLIYAYYYINFLSIPHIFKYAKWGKNAKLIKLAIIVVLISLWIFEHIYYIYRKCLYKKAGDAVEYFDNAAKCLGIVFFKFPNENVMRNVLEHINDLITVELQ